MTDLISLLSTLVPPDGKILVKGVDEMVPEPDEETSRYYNYLVLLAEH